MTPGGDTLAIQAFGLGRRFGQIQAVSDLNLEVRKGEMFGLVGPDGAGKTTTLRLLCGIMRPSSGEASVLGFDLRREPERIKSHIGYLSQSFTLYGDLTVDENIEFFAELHGVRRFQTRREELLAFTRLGPFRKRLAYALSGGMKKKLALACTLVHTPDLIFLDEPSTGVDPLSRGEFWNILSRVLAQGVTIVITTPYLDEAERCDRIGLIHRGSVFTIGTPSELKASLPGQVYQIQSDDPAGSYRALRAMWSSTQLVLYGDRIHLWSLKGEEDAEASVALLDRRGLGPASHVRVDPSLEDVFVGILGSREGEGGMA